MQSQTITCRWTDRRIFRMKMLPRLRLRLTGWDKEKRDTWHERERFIIALQFMFSYISFVQEQRHRQCRLPICESVCVCVRATIWIVSYHHLWKLTRWMKEEEMENVTRDETSEQWQWTSREKIRLNFIQMASSLWQCSVLVGCGCNFEIKKNIFFFVLFCFDVHSI